MSTIRIRRNRAKRKRAFLVHKPKWIDPYPLIPGTEPEKRIFEALIKSRIYFIYQGQIPELEEGIYVTMAIPGFKPDFILPEYRVIIDPFSPFHHSQPEAVERDIRKMALYNALGYKFYHPWARDGGLFDYDQQELRAAHLTALPAVHIIPEVQRGPRFKLKNQKDIQAKAQKGYRIGQYVGAGATSVAAANRSRRKPPKLTIRTGTRRSKRGRRLT